MKQQSKARARQQAKARKAEQTVKKPSAGKPGASSRSEDRFDVPRPGGRLSGGRGAHVAARMIALSGVTLLALGTVGVLAYTAGHPAPVDAGITEKQIAQYRLSSFPVEQAIAFADRYARLCLNQNQASIEQRRAAIARLSSAGVDTSCGWDGKGNQAVAYSVWSGYLEPVPEYGKNAYYVGIQAQLTSGALRTVAVPVYVQDLAAGNGMRVVGDVGTIPQPEQASPPKVKRPAQEDSRLSSELRGKLFQDFFAAWASSNNDNLARYVSPEATKAARGGLRGSLQSPEVTSVRVLLPAGVPATREYTWKVGEKTWAWVGVKWKASSGGTTTERFRLQIVLTDQGWFVRDIRAGVPDERGGSAPST